MRYPIIKSISVEPTLLGTEELDVFGEAHILEAKLAYIGVAGESGSLESARAKLAGVKTAREALDAIDGYKEWVDELCGDCRFCGCDMASHIFDFLPDAHFNAVVKTDDPFSVPLPKVWSKDKNGSIKVAPKRLADPTPTMRTLFCAKCAERINTSQAVCFTRSIGVGEVV